MSVYAGAAAALFVIGAGRMALAWRQRSWIRQAARKLYDARRAVYSEIPTHRALNNDELPVPRSALDGTSSAMPGFTRLADYVDVYPEGSRFAENNLHPLRALVDREGTTVALVFRPRGSDVVRVHLVTELSDGRWLLTENNKNEPIGALARPPSFVVIHVLRSSSPAAMIAAHGERLADLTAESGSSTYGSTSLLVPIRSFDDYVASHERRWNAIRKHRKDMGWLLRSEIPLAPGTPAAIGDRIHEEILRLAAADTEVDATHHAR